MTSSSQQRPDVVVYTDNAKLPHETVAELADGIFDGLRNIRGVNIRNVSEKSQLEQDTVILSETSNFRTILEDTSNALSHTKRAREAEALARALDHAIQPKRQGGFQLSPNSVLQAEDAKNILGQVEAWLESLNAAERAHQFPRTLTSKPVDRYPMTLSQKIFAHHAIGVQDPRGLRVGDVIRVAVDWIIASEISWVGMKKTLEQFDSYQVWRNDRFWLAGDHVVDPRNYETDLSKKLIGASEKAAKDFKLTDYKGANYTIIHTEFVRSRAEPGMLAIGSDSHTCSSGAVGCLAIGLGAADVAMPLVTGETWFKVPEAINVRFVGEPGLGIGGKDTILYILSELKRNTVAAERIVEFSGPGVKHLSIDARFAISNMCTEFGAITGVFIPDNITRDYISVRKQKNRKSSSLYFSPDADAEYAGTYTIDLSKVTSFFAIYPEPDDVVPVKDKEGMHLDGCFIGACTTALEDLILGAMVLQAGLDKGMKVVSKGKRHVVPGSLPVRQRLEELGLSQVYEDAGFTIGAPGCSFCVGMGSDQAQAGETWLSSQNRNFKNRMGKGSFGNLSSAATVAASSFSMTVTDPTALLAELDMELFDKYRGHSSKLSTSGNAKSVDYVEPGFHIASNGNSMPSGKASDSAPTASVPAISSKVVRLGDYIDTDALAPAEYLVTVDTDEGLGQHCLEHTNPEFRSKVRDGQRVVVAGEAFGVGSSREEAVRALQGAGVECVIAKSFAFIYGRNQPNLGLLGIVITDKEFHSLATEGADISIDIDARSVSVGGKSFSFTLSDIEIALLANKGISESYKKFGNAVFSKLCGVTADAEGPEVSKSGLRGDEDNIMEELMW